MWAFAPAPSAANSPASHHTYATHATLTRPRAHVDDDSMSISHFPPTNIHSAPSPLSLSPFPPHTSHTSILRRRSRAEKDDSSDDDDSDDDLDDDNGVDSDDDGDGFARRSGSSQSKRVKLSALMPLAFTSTSLSPPFQPSSRAGSTVNGSSSLWAPVRPARSRSMGDGNGNGLGANSPPSLTLQSPPRSPLHHAATAVSTVGADSGSSSLPPLSPSSAAAAASSVSGKRVPLQIIPPASLARTRSSGSLFSPRSHTTQFLAPPAVTHSPRAVQPDSQHSPLETLFTRLTMEDASRARGWSDGMDDRGVGYSIKGFRARRGSGGGGGEHRRSFSVTLSPAMAQSITRSGGVDASPLKLIAEEDDEAAGMQTPPPARRSVSPLATPFLVRVDSAEEMHDNLSPDSSSASASPPSALTGDSILHFFHQLRLDANDWTTLALAWRWKCKQGGVIYRSEFIDGMRAMGCETIEQLQSEVERLKEQLLQPGHRSEYKDFFAFVFHFVRRTHETSRRTIPMDTACRLLESLLSSRYEVHVRRLCRYMREGGGGRATTARVTFDQWQSLLDWVENMDVEYMAYEEENSCWPVMLDDFIEWMRQHDKPTMARYEARRQERITQRQLADPEPSASSFSSYPTFTHPHQSDSIVDRITRLRVEHTAEPLLPASPSVAVPSALSTVSSLTPRRSSLSVRVPRPSSIEAVSLDSDDMPRPYYHSQAGGGMGGELDASMLSRSLPSIGTISDLHEEADPDRAEQGGRTFAWDRGDSMSD